MSHANNAQRRAKYANDPDYRKRVLDKNIESQKRYKEIQKNSPIINLSRAASQCKRREGGNITTSFLLNMWIEQDGKCALTGLPMTWGGGVVNSMNFSIDRIDQTRGYFKDNVRIVCWCVNSFRQKMNDDELLKVAVALVNTLSATKKTQQLIETIGENHG